MVREALVEPPELPRDLVYEADLTRLRQVSRPHTLPELTDGSRLWRHGVMMFSLKPPLF